VTSQYISAFKTAKVTPIYKKDDTKVVSNYCPINLLSAFSKIIEKALHIEF